MFLDNPVSQDDFKSPSRKPWVLLLIVILVCAGSYQAYRIIRDRRDVPSTQGEPPAQALTNSVPVTVDNSSSNLTAQTAGLAILKEAKDLETANKHEEAFQKYRSIITATNDSRIVEMAEFEMGKLSIAVLFSPIMTSEKMSYSVRPGDSLEKIAKSHGTTVNLIRRANGFSEAKVLHAGDTLVLTKAVFSLVCSKSANDMVLYINGLFCKRYRVCTGKMGKTPEGTFAVNDKIVEPPWWRGDKMLPFGDKENILGTRWMSIKATGSTPSVKGYGIHGTWNDASIGTADSAGCIRMHNADVEEVFDILPLGAKVTITP